MYRLTICVWFASLLTGCGGGEKPNVLTGKITLDGQSVDNVLIVAEGPNKQSVGGNSDGNGNYKIENPPIGSIRLQLVEVPGQAKGPVRPKLAAFSKPAKAVPYDMKPGSQTFDIVLKSDS